MSQQYTHKSTVLTKCDKRSLLLYKKPITIRSKQISNTNGAVHICDGCLLRFPTMERINNHQQHHCSHICVTLPSNEKTTKNWFDQEVSNDKLELNKFKKNFNFRLLFTLILRRF